MDLQWCIGRYISHTTRCRKIKEGNYLDGTISRVYTHRWVLARGWGQGSDEANKATQKRIHFDSQEEENEMMMGTGNDTLISLVGWERKIKDTRFDASLTNRLTIPFPQCITDVESLHRSSCACGPSLFVRWTPLPVPSHFDTQFGQCAPPMIPLKTKKGKFDWKFPQQRPNFNEWMDNKKSQIPAADIIQLL